MKKHILFLVLLLTFSCQKSEIINSPIEKENSLYNLKISKKDSLLNSEDAVKVAKLFNFTTPLTKGDKERTVKNVKAINNSGDSPLMYAINYNDNRGFIIVSATKKYYPIIAIVEKGEFSEECYKTGMSVILAETEAAIKHYMTLPKDSLIQVRDSWMRYEKNQEYYATKTGDELLELVENSIAEWDAAGYTYSSLSEGCPDGLPQNVYNNFCDAAEAIAHPDYSYMDNSFILVERTDYTSGSVNGLLSTSWEQGNGYNAAIPLLNGQRPPAGCVAVAMGQIMRYHRHPNYFIWNDMPDNYATTTTANLLYNIGLSVNMQYLPNISYTNNVYAQDALINVYNYALGGLIPHNLDRVYASLDSLRPVYMSGVDPMYSGHAWVCDSRVIMGYTKYYTLKIISVVTPPLQYENAGSYGPYSSVPLNFLHMNWGRDIYNGLFGATNTNVSIYNFSQGREDIVDIHPR